MEWIYRELSGVMLPEQKAASDNDVASINNLLNPPPVPVTAREVYIRRCRLAGDAIDAGFGRFRTSDLPKLLAMIQGAPALIGHRRESLGVARFFGGSVESDTRNGVNYIVPKFYWMRAHSGAEDLRINLDGGIWCEASLGFVFKRPTCSVCVEDIRRCEHILDSDYNGSQVFFYYDDIVRVTEGSLVYRGAQPGTGFMLSDFREIHQLAFTNSPRFKWQGIWYRGIPEKLG